jgi:peroxiredoxin
MTGSGPVAVGDRLPDLRLQAADGSEVALAALRGRPLLLVCLRYYG